MLADGAEFEGEAIGALDLTGATTGEVVFNTALSGYQEIVTDPSYAGQIITFTYPHIGNYGVNETDDESRRPVLRGRGRARPRSACEQLARHCIARRPARAPRRARASRASTRGASPATSATTARCPGAFGTDEQAVRAAAAKARARPTASTWSRASPPTGPIS